MDKCSFPRCKYLAVFGYMGKNICGIHWDELCTSDRKTEKRMLKKIGMIRDERGSVVIIKNT